MTLDEGLPLTAVAPEEVGELASYQGSGTGTKRRNAATFAVGAIVQNGATIASTLLLPRVLTTTAYAEWRLFSLYFAYVGLFHLGILDGLLFRWARRRSKAIPPAFGAIFFILCVVGSVVASLALAFYLFTGSTITSRLALAIGTLVLLWNVLALAQVVLLASSRFRLLAVQSSAVAVLFTTSVLLGLPKRPEVGGAQMWFVASVFVTAVPLLIYLLRGGIHVPGRARLKRLLAAAFAKGFGILTTNLLLLALANFDRMIVSVTFPITEFGRYGFAASLIGIGGSAVLAVSQYVVPQITSRVFLGTLREFLTSLFGVLYAGWLLMMAALVAGDRLLQLGYPQYAASVRLAVILGVGLGFLAPVQAIYLNVARASGKTREAVRLALVAIVVGAILVFLATTTRSLSITAGAGVLVFVLWWGLNVGGGYVGALHEIRPIALRYGAGVLIAGTACVLGVGQSLPIELLLALACVIVAAMVLRQTTARAAV